MFHFYQTESIHLCYECSSSPTSQELSSSIFQSLSVCEWVISDTLPNIHFLRYIKKPVLTDHNQVQPCQAWKKYCVPWHVMWSFSVIRYHFPPFSVDFAEISVIFCLINLDHCDSCWLWLILLGCLCCNSCWSYSWRKRWISISERWQLEKSIFTVLQQIGSGPFSTKISRTWHIFQLSKVVQNCFKSSIQLFLGFGTI